MSLLFILTTTSEVHNLAILPEMKPWVTKIKPLAQGKVEKLEFQTALV